MLRLAALLLPLLAIPVFADGVEARDGWAVHPTSYDYQTLLSRTQEAVRESSLAIVTEAGPTQAAANRGVTIPGNRVIGAFNNVYAVRILELSPEAMIEAPIRLYVTENSDGTATLSYKTPSFVFSPYMEGADPDLAVAAAELDAIFAAVAAEALAE